jgi:hypothetical protein
MTVHAHEPRVMGRREFIAGAGVAAVGLVVLGARGLIGSAEPFARTPILEHIGETFRVASGPAAGAVLRIAEIRALPYGSVGDIENQFLVRLAGVSGPELPQDTYEFATQSFGKLPLFITPMSDPGASAAFYDAIVNRFVPTTGGRP